MRSPKELAFRIGQEAANIGLRLFPPQLAADQTAPLEGLPDPAAIVSRLQGTKFTAEITGLAEQILAHRFPILGLEVQTGREIRWRRDYVNQVEGPARYFRFVRFLNFSEAGDHKIVWELNRHQHLVVLAQVYRFTGRADFLSEICGQVESWLEANPYLRGINWASALEVAFRALSWTWVYHLAGMDMPEDFRRRFLEALYRHGCYLERNLSIYFSPNTHLLGEAVALHALGLLFPAFPRSAAWKKRGAELVEIQMERQMREDGSHFEQSVYYHLYALDMLLFHHALAGAGRLPPERVRRMAEYLAALTGATGPLPMLGDEDGGRFFHPYGRREYFGRATLATCGVLFQNSRWIGCEEDLHEQASWWLGTTCLDTTQPGAGPDVSRLFPGSGVAVMPAGGLRIIVDAGPFGGGSGGHSHSDTLSVVVESGGRQLLADSGTCTYVSADAARDWFRGAAAHNTIRIDGKDQAEPAGPFRWSGAPRTAIREWATSPEQDFLDAECRYRGFLHRRRFLFVKPDLLLIFDRVEGPGGEHLLEQFWHFGGHVNFEPADCFRLGERGRLVLQSVQETDFFLGGEHGWRSPVYGLKVEAEGAVKRLRGPLPAELWAALDFSGAGGATLESGGMGRSVLRRGNESIITEYPAEGMPRLWRGSA